MNTLKKINAFCNDHFQLLLIVGMLACGLALVASTPDQSRTVRATERIAAALEMGNTLAQQALLDAQDMRMAAANAARPKVKK